MPPKTANEKRKLPPKENSLFQSIAKAYEQKQYKKGLKVRVHRLLVAAYVGSTL